MDLLKYLRTQWDRVTAWALIAGAAVALVAGWLGVSRTPFPSEQIPYIVSGGLLAVCLVAVGAMLWLSADLRDEWRKLDAIEDELRGANTERANVAAPHSQPRASGEEDGPVAQAQAARAVAGL